MQISHSLKIVKKIKETIDAFSFELQVPEDKKALFHYKPGQFITLFMHIDGEAVNRSYSFSSSPMADKNLKITVKRVPGGKGSNYLINEVQEGDSLNVSPPAGSFFNMSQTIEDHLHYYMFAAGSGVTPMMSILKWSLPALPNHKITLLYSNKTPDSSLFLKELTELEKQHPHFNVVYFFSQSEDPRRLSSEELSFHLNQAFNEEVQKSFYLCGPEAYMQMITHELQLKEVGSEWIHRESFYTSNENSASAADTKDENIVIGLLPEGLDTSECQTIEADINGEMVSVESVDGQSILETLLEEGHTPPFSCMSGSCQACMCEISEGKVYQEDAGILTTEDIENKKFLSCQAHGLSKAIKIKFID